MKDTELWIDGKLADIDENTNVLLDIKCNLLRDITQMESNSTFSVSLPKTLRNEGIMSHAGVVQSGGAFAYAEHKARFVRDGIVIIANGTATLTSVSADSFELTIVWGLWDKFSALNSDGTALNDLVGDDRIMYQATNDIAKYTDIDNENYFYACYDPWITDTTVDYTWKSTATTKSPIAVGGGTFGGDRTHFGSGGTPGVQNTVARIHPVVRVPWVLKLIKEQTGIDFAWSGDAKAFINTLVIPLVDKKASELTFDAKTEGTLAFEGKNTGALSITLAAKGNIFKESGYSTMLTAAADTDILLTVSAQWAWNNQGSMPNGRGDRGDTYTTPGYYIKITHTSGQDKTEYKCGPQLGFTVPSGYKGVIVATLGGSGKITLKTGDTLKFDWCHDQKGLYQGAFGTGSITASAVTGDEVPAGGYYPICSNLPGIKVIDFIQFLASITGTYMKQLSDPGKVEFLPMSLLWDNKASAVDWTGKLEASNTTNQPRQMKYRQGDYAQHNYYKWKADAKVVTSYDGDMTIQDATLEAEKNIIEFPFAACEGNNVPMYSGKRTIGGGGGTFGGGTSSGGTSSGDTSESADTVRYNKCEYKILRLKESDNGLALCYFDINMQRIIDEKYSHIRDALNNARIITEYLPLTDVDLREFDETRPVYFSQYGAYFAVLEMKATNDGYTECTMLKLN